MYVYRAQCFNVVDGDTVDLLVDLGFRQYAKTRFRLARINTCELNSVVEVDRAKAQAAKEYVVNAIRVVTIDWKVWPLRIEVKKDPDNYGRWLAEIFYVPNSVGRYNEVSLNQELLDLGLAVLYKG